MLSFRKPWFTTRNAVLVVLPTFLVAIWQFEERFTITSDRPLNSTRLSGQVRRELSPKMQPDGTQVSRSLMRLPAGLCVIEHHRPSLPVSTAAFPYSRQDSFGEIMFEENSSWYRGQNVGVCVSTFNCGTFSVCDFLTLTPADWIGVEPTADGYPTPIAVIIDSYFMNICEFHLMDSDYRHAFENSQQLCDGDLVAFEFSESPSRPLNRTFTHLGRVQKRNGINRMLSKFGPGPIVLSDLDFPLRMFPGADVVKAYRVRPHVSDEQTAFENSERPLVVQAAWHSQTSELRPAH